MLKNLARLALVTGLLAAAGVAPAATPASGALSPANPEISFESGPHAVSNPSATGGELQCATPALPCDDFTLTVELPADYTTTHPDHRITISTSWGALADDYDVYLLDESGAEVNAAAGSSNPEVMEITPQAGTFTLRVVPFLVTGSVAHTVIRLGPPESGSAPAPPEAAGLAPRFKAHVSPPELGNDSGEPTIGFNPLSQRAMFISYVNALRLTFAENETPPLPASCDARWEDKTGFITTLNTLDPIIYTDQVTGRTFNSQLSGANSLFEYSDDDGETWTPGQIGPPNGGADHQGVVSGPYPEGFPMAGVLYDRAVYYCSQSVALAFCSRSDDGGQTFGPGYPFKNTDCSAGALHGHPKLAPDGTLYVPDSSQCVVPVGVSAEKVVAFVSEDAGMSYEARPLPDSAGGAGSDPSIGIATDGTVYMCYENADGRTRVAVSKDKGLTWENDTDVGAAAGLIQTRFPAMVAGDPDRAACAFLGTTTEGNGESLDFEGVWYPYIATTYDSGETWHLVNVSPNDPVQGYGGVGPSGTNRNLLDFNDMEVDDQGRLLFAYADGCVDGCVADPSQNSFAAKGVVVRQTGGRTMFAALDDNAGTRYNSTQAMTPAAACASSTKSARTQVRTVVAWDAPDDGGAPVGSYKVYRALAPNEPFTLVGDAGGKTRFVDTTASTAVEKYYYKVVAENALGTAPESNVIELPIVQETVANTCALPGELIAIDGVGDGGVPDTDIEYVGVAEPPEYEGNLVITMKIQDFTSGEPLATSFFTILFPQVDSLYVAMDVSQALPRFVYGRTEELPQGLLAFAEEGTLDERSSYGADGTIVMVVPKTLFGDDVQPGTIISGFDARVRVGTQSASSRDIAGPGFYTVRGTVSCADVTLPLALLTADRTSGNAPLTVNFTAGVSNGVEAQSYTLNPGDGSPEVTQSTPDFTHTYHSAGTFPARLKVTDTEGNVSTNRAEQFIEVLGEGAAGGVVDNNRFGGALGLALLLPLFALALRRRRA